MPLTPFWRLRQKVSTSFPTGDITPRPVMTTLRSEIISRVTELRSPRSHPNALHRLEQFAFGLDRGGYDDFGLLKLGDGARADVAHAGCDGAYEVLTPVVHLSRAKENLFQGAGRAHFNAGSARQICVRRCHSPMVSTPRRFIRF